MPFYEIKSYSEPLNILYVQPHWTYKLYNISKINCSTHIVINIEYKNNDNVSYINMKIYNTLFINLLTDYYYDNFPGLYQLQLSSSLNSNKRILSFTFYIDTELVELGLNKLYSLDCAIYSSDTLNLRNFTLDDKSFYNNLPEENSIIKIKFPQFFKYQRQNITKMLNLESNKNISISSIINMPFDDKIFNYNLHTGKYNEPNDKSLLIKTNGGILADEMGLGKTISMIGLTFFNPYKGVVGYIKDKKIQSKANLIIVPSHLSKQWEEEIKKFLPNKKIVKIYTKINHSKITYQDIIDSDYVIVTQQFLLNFNYYIREGYKYVTPTTYYYPDRISFINDKFDDWIKNKIKYNELTSPFLEVFNFHRIIIDEGHEIFEKNLGNYRLNEYLLEFLNYNIHGNFRWYISGSPFTSFIGIHNCLKFIKFNFSQINEPYDVSLNGFKFPSIGIYFNYNHPIIFNEIIKNITIRSLKNDITDEIKLPGYEEEYHFVELTDTERKLYNSKKTNSSHGTLQQMCCHPLIADSFRKIIGNEIISLDVMHDKLISHHTNNISTYENKISKLDQTNQSYHMLLSNFKSKISESKFIINMMTKITEETEITEENCVICFDTMENPVLTKCGHIFCKECILQSMKFQSVCPQCRNKLSGEQFYSLEKPKNVNKVEQVNPFIKKYGSKLGKLIIMIRKLTIDENSKIIVFSQWDSMLSLIGTSLADNGIENTFIKGNVYARNNAISKFRLGVDSQGKESNSNVIMLSLENAASGTNLTEADYIFFVEPINKSKNEISAIEGQAIGRVCRIGQKNKVKIIRIITKDTIEEEIYKESYI
jgi:SWI/SNF-related matrix-associated actin-dependent regulator of chromatin subfamily A3